MARSSAAAPYRSAQVFRAYMGKPIAKAITEMIRVTRGHSSNRYVSCRYDDGNGEFVFITRDLDQVRIAGLPSNMSELFQHLKDELDP